MRNSFQIFISFVLGILIVFFGVYVLFYLGLNEWKRVGETRVLLAERQATVKRLNDLIKKFREQLSLFDNLNQQTGLIDKSLPASLRIPELLVSIESVALENNIGLKHISFVVLESMRDQDGGFREFSGVGIKQEAEPFPVSIALDGTGNYLGVKKFLKGIEEELRLMDVKSFEIIPLKKDEKAQDSASFSFKLNLEAYSIKKPQFTLP